MGGGFKALSIEQLNSKGYILNSLNNIKTEPEPADNVGWDNLHLKENICCNKDSRWNRLNMNLLFLLICRLF